MTVLLVLFFFTTFLVIDHFRSRHAVQPVLQVAPSKTAAAVASAPRLQPAVVGGFAIPENLRYHPGHTWALSESTNLVRVGMDDFASKLTGTVDTITLPQRGQWIRQGQKMCTIHRAGVAVDMVSPIEGTISDINEAVAKNPKLALSDSYGDGWLVTVNAPDAKTSFRNLLGGPLARWWMEESASRLQRRIPMAMPMAFAGALAQDGGEAVSVSSQIPDQQWLPVAKEFFLS
ncbi:MAG: glycine cleavage system protein H [Terriglobales bacterium]|jgi:glycine cleavage system H lipoate-binding protein